MGVYSRFGSLESHAALSCSYSVSRLESCKRLEKDGTVLFMDYAGGMYRLNLKTGAAVSFSFFPLARSGDLEIAPHGLACIFL